MENLLKRIEVLEYHQQLLIRMLKETNQPLYYFIIVNNLSRSETEHILEICEMMNKKFQKQKAEGYVTFYPLLQELQANISPSISIKDLVDACIKQEVYVLFMEEMKQLLNQ
ncbi:MULTISPECIES: DUF1878 family protein [Bacillus]|uniref:DUF1878 family protein n=1 Tax=Bacillus TaxID=1386 RepID=UPI00031CED05|nr:MULTISPECIES: DUF1878 family protein [Bacillus]